ncbi:MAG: Rne/Rng family ribonuclease [Gammaproteobacteria bacterium]|nr:Rne/Rng family ribonuclease [Gammaproteobacteria bacterium]
MKRMLINATLSDQLRVALTDNALLINLDIDHFGHEQKKANIYKGKISSIEPSLGAVFVDYGAERHGFLPLKEISHEYFLSQSPEDFQNPDIRKVLKLGQELVIQVEKEERGSKGAALTTFISLAGSYLVLMPNNPRAGGISRRIEGDERDQLRDAINQLEIPDGMGIIIRTAGVGRSSEELKWDLEVLLRYWEAIKQAAVVKAGPYLIHQESDAIIRAIRDYLRQDIEEIIIDEPQAFERAKNYLSQVRPDFAERIKLYDDNLPLFSRFQIEQQIENAYQRELRLPSGGSVVIDVTEALVSIDINSARATKGSNIEETALNTNLEAAEEIARQLRIRDIGGLVVIDFIDMTPSANQRKVENCLRSAFKFDRARIQMGRISRFGLLEMSRQRLRASLSRAIQTTCPRCEGTGNIRAIESIATSIIHLIQEHAAHTNNAAVQLQIQVPVDVATYLLNEKRDMITDIHANSSLDIMIIPNPHLQSPHYQLNQVRLDPNNHRNLPSYKLIRIPKADSSTSKKSTPKAKIEVPAINDFLSNQTPTRSSGARSSNNGLIKRLWSIMFGSDNAPSKPAKKTSQRRKSSTTRKTTGNRTRKTGTDTRRSGNNTNRNRRGTRGGQQRHGNRNSDSRSQSRSPTERRQTRSDDQKQSRAPAKPRRPRSDDQKQSRAPAKPRQSRSDDQKQSGPNAKRNNQTTASNPAENKTAGKSSTVRSNAIKSTPIKTEKAPAIKAVDTKPVVTEVKSTAAKTPKKAAPSTTKKSAAAYQSSNYKGFGHGGDSSLEQVKTKDDKPVPTKELSSEDK